MAFSVRNGRYSPRSSGQNRIQLSSRETLFLEKGREWEEEDKCLLGKGPGSHCVRHASVRRAKSVSSDTSIVVWPQQGQPQHEAMGVVLKSPRGTLVPMPLLRFQALQNRLLSCTSTWAKQRQRALLGKTQPSDRQTDRQTDRHTDTQTRRHTDTHMSLCTPLHEHCVGSWTSFCLHARAAHCVRGPRSRTCVHRICPLLNVSSARGLQVSLPESSDVERVLRKSLEIDFSSGS